MTSFPRVAALLLPSLLLPLATATGKAGPLQDAERSAAAQDAWSPLTPIDPAEFPRHADTRLEPFEHEELPTDVCAIEVERPDGTFGLAFVSAADGVLATKKPLLLWNEGSGANSVFTRWPQGLSGGLFRYLAATFGDRYHVVAVEKRGVDFGQRAPQGSEDLQASETYHEFATWEGRVGEACLVLDALLAHPNVDDEHVLVLGHSEGGDVAAGIAAVREEVTHVAVLSGAGGCQWAELMMLARQQGRAQGLSEEDVEAQVAALEADYRAIMEDPLSIRKRFYGHAYRRWSSFGRRPPVESLLAAQARIYLAIGTRDQAVPIESFDHAVVELMRHGRTDVTVRRVPGADHGFATPDDVDQNGILQALEEAVAWAREAEDG